MAQRADVETSAFGRGRVTPQRRAIARAVMAARGSFTIDDLAAIVRRAEPGAGATATVYRAVAAMENAGFIERVGARGGSALYARCDASAHHHHIVCDACGVTAEAECPLGTTLDVAGTAGFVVTRHEVTLYGLCPTCARKRGR